MKREEYLTSRGWTEGKVTLAGWWRDPTVSRVEIGPDDSGADSFTVATEHAVTIQRARDAAEARAHYSRCYAAAMREVGGAWVETAHVHAVKALEDYFVLFGAPARFDDEPEEGGGS